MMRLFNVAFLRMHLHYYVTVGAFVFVSVICVKDWLRLSKSDLLEGCLVIPSCLALK